LRLTARVEGSAIRRIALEEDFVMNDPVHIDWWRSLVTMIPEPFIEKILPALKSMGNSSAWLNAAPMSSGRLA
jgi:hypothetical protein